MTIIHVMHELTATISWIDGTKDIYEHIDEVRFNEAASNIIELLRYVRVGEDDTVFDDDDIQTVNYIMASNVFEIMVKRSKIDNEEDKNEDVSAKDDSN